MSDDRPVLAGVEPTPDPGVLAAIVAAVAEVWPRPAPPAAPAASRSRWRFSGRWWAQPSAARRDRPWSPSR